MAMAVVCKKCGFERELSIFEIKSANWKRRPCPVCNHIEPPKRDETKHEPDEAA